jgi:hypothetical protein
MNMLCKLDRHRSDAYLILEISEIRLREKSKKNSISLSGYMLESCFFARMPCYEGFEASFSDFKISEVCGDFSGIKIAYCLVCNMWKVYPRSSSALIFLL